MLSKSDLLKVLAELTARGTDLLKDQQYTDGTLCRREDRTAVREIADLMHKLYRSFDYGRSPEFLREMAGKPESFVAMRRRLFEEPARRAEQRLRLRNALGEVLTSRAAFQLVPEAQHAMLRRIITAAQRLANPLSG